MAACKGVEGKGAGNGAGVRNGRLQACRLLVGPLRGVPRGCSTTRSGRTRAHKAARGRTRPHEGAQGRTTKESRSRECWYAASQRWRAGQSWHGAAWAAGCMVYERKVSGCWHRAKQSWHGAPKGAKSSGKHSNSSHGVVVRALVLGRRVPGSNPRGCFMRVFGTERPTGPR